MGDDWRVNTSPGTSALAWQWPLTSSYYDTLFLYVVVEGGSMLSVCVSCLLTCVPPLPLLLNEAFQQCRSRQCYVIAGKLPILRLRGKPAAKICGDVALCYTHTNSAYICDGTSLHSCMGAGGLSGSRTPGQEVFPYGEPKFHQKCGPSIDQRASNLNGTLWCPNPTDN